MRETLRPLEREATLAGCPAVERSRVLALSAAIACVTAVGIGLSLSIPLLSLEMERMGLSGTLIGLNTAVAGLASICVAPFAPRWAARVGVVPLLWLSVAIGGATLVLFKAAFDFAWWFPIRFAFSAALAVLFVLSEYWITTAAPPRRRGLVIGIYATALGAGFALGPALLALVGTSGWPPYLAGAALFVLAGLPLVLARGLSPGLPAGPGRPLLSFIRTAPAATLAAFVFGAIETGGFALLPLYGLQSGFSAERAAFLVSIVALGNVALQIPIGLLSDRIDRRQLLLAAGGAGAAGAALLPAASASEPALHVLLFVWGGVSGALYPLGLAHLGTRFAGADLASANAAYVSLYSLGLLVGPPLIGIGMDVDARHGFAWSLAAFLTCYALVVLPRARRADAGA